MKLLPTQDPTAFDAFITEQGSDQFLQSWDWGEFQKNAGRNVLRFFITDDSGAKTFASAQIIAMPLPMGLSYWYLPRGPVFQRNLTDAERLEILKTLINGAQRTPGTKKIFFRLEPGWIDDQPALHLDQLSVSFRLVKLSKTVQPQETLILNLEQSDEELLSQLHQKTRYNIGLAKRKGVITMIRPEENAFAAFWRLMQTTAKRNNITQHAYDYYHLMFKSLSRSQGCHVLLNTAEYEGQILAANLVVRFNGIATYLHGASDNIGRNLMAPHLLQWFAILSAKHRGAKRYDFWGITTSENPNHPWAGITRFKKGFGGSIVRYAPAADLVYHRGWYGLYRLLKKSPR